MGIYAIFNIMDDTSQFVYLKTHEAFFTKHGRRFEYSKNQYILRGDDPSIYVYFLIEGLAKLSFTSANHDERIIGYFLPGMNFAQTRSFFEADGGGLEYTTVTKCVLYRLPIEEFLHELTKNTAFKDEYIQQLMRNQIYLLDSAVYMGEADIYHRMVRWLLLMAKYYGNETDLGIRIFPGLTQATICNFIRASRESVASTLKRLMREGAITVEKKHITVTTDVCRRILDN